MVDLPNFLDNAREASSDNGFVSLSGSSENISCGNKTELTGRRGEKRTQCFRQVPVDEHRELLVPVEGFKPRDMRVKVLVKN